MKSFFMSTILAFRLKFEVPQLIRQLHTLVSLYKSS